MGAEYPPFPSDPKPIAGVVSLRELQHPTRNKAIRAAYDAQKLERAKKILQAIAKLEYSTRIDPEYRDSHINLGVLYARTGRITDARAQFQKALDIGPPDAMIYEDLAVTSLTLHQAQEAATFARKALEFSPPDSHAKLAQDHSLTH